MMSTGSHMCTCTLRVYTCTSPKHARGQHHHYYHPTQQAMMLYHTRHMVPCIDTRQASSQNATSVSVLLGGMYIPCNKMLRLTSMLPIAVLSSICIAANRIHSLNIVPAASCFLACNLQPFCPTMFAPCSCYSRRSVPCPPATGHPYLRDDADCSIYSFRSNRYRTISTICPTLGVLVWLSRAHMVLIGVLDNALEALFNV